MESSSIYSVVIGKELSYEGTYDEMGIVRWIEQIYRFPRIPPHTLPI